MSVIKKESPVDQKQVSDLLPNNKQKTLGEVPLPDEYRRKLGSTANFVPLDGGWGWLVCFASFWTNGTICWTINSFGILFAEFLKVFGNGNDAFRISWVGALHIAMTFMMSPVVSALVDRIGIQMTAFIGVVLSTIGMLSSSFADRVEVLYFTYGFIFGLGNSLIFIPSLAIIGHYFQKYIGLVNGIVSSGGSIFTFALPFALNALIKTSGIKRTMQYMSISYAILIACVYIWRPNFNMCHKELDKYLASQTSMTNRWRGCAQWAIRFFNFSIWKNRRYKIWALSMSLAFIGYFVPFVHLIQHVKIVFPNSRGEILVMCIGGASGLGKIICGQMADSKRVNRVAMQQISLVIFGVCTIFIPVATAFSHLIVISVIIGLSDGCIVCLIGPIAFDCLGPIGAAQGLGGVLGLMSIPMTLGPPIAGFLYDYLGTYDVAFYLAGVPPLLGASCMFLVTRRKKKIRAVSAVESLVLLSRLDMEKADVIDYPSISTVVHLPLNKIVPGKLQTPSKSTLHNSAPNVSSMRTPSKSTLHNSATNVTSVQKMTPIS